MKNIIKALVTALYQHESWGADVIDDNVSVNALAEVAAILKDATAEEIAALEDSLTELSKSTTNPDFSDYCNEFIDFFIKEYNQYW
ncbi:MAG: hypothetical protein ACI9YE_002985 [Psychroserpens sp.]|jgi:hypothetical protein